MPHFASESSSGSFGFAPMQPTIGERCRKWWPTEILVDVGDGNLWTTRERREFQILLNAGPYYTQPPCGSGSSLHVDPSMLALGQHWLLSGLMLRKCGSNLCEQGYSHRLRDAAARDSWRVPTSGHPKTRPGAILLTAW